MTIPSRPAPAPPGSRGNAAAGANASIEQLRLQLQQQQQQLQQQQHHKLLIKLPPPPQRPGSAAAQLTGASNINNNHHSDLSNKSITRKFPTARYTPTTSWDDAPFGGAGDVSVTNNNFKKAPPPRPPPPKVQTIGKKSTAPPPPPPAGGRPVQQTGNVLVNLFNRKPKSSKSTSNANANASRIYGVSSGLYGSTSNITSSSSQQTSNQSNYNTHTNPSSWSANWSATNTTTTTTTSNNIHFTLNQQPSAATGGNAQEAQLISFDSPPSSPTFTQKSNSDCVSVDSFSSDSNFSSPQNGSVSQPESGFEDDFSGARSRPATTSPLDPWETLDVFNSESSSAYGSTATIGTAPVRNLNAINTRIQSSNDNPLCNGKSLLPPAPSLTVPTIIKPKISQKPKAPKPPSFGMHLHASSSLSSTNTDAGTEDDPPTPPSPPMPKCAPPPPPVGVTLLDVISGKVDALHLASDISTDEAPEQPYGIALYNFDGVEEGDLNFRENEKIYLLEQVSDEWYRGRTRAGCEGIFPGNYIEIKVPLHSAAGDRSKTSCVASMNATTTTTTTNTSTSTYLSQHSEYTRQGQQQQRTFIPPRVRCLYNFPADVQGDLELKENDLVTILYRINEDWLYGEANGSQGQFPANFLEYVPDNIPMP